MFLPDRKRAPAPRSARPDSVSGSGLHPGHRAGAWLLATVPCVVWVGSPTHRGGVGTGAYPWLRCPGWRPPASTGSLRTVVPGDGAGGRWARLSTRTIGPQSGLQRAARPPPPTWKEPWVVVPLSCPHSKQGVCGQEASDPLPGAPEAAGGREEPAGRWGQSPGGRGPWPGTRRPLPLRSRTRLVRPPVCSPDIVCARWSIGHRHFPLLLTHVA